MKFSSGVKLAIIPAVIALIVFAWLWGLNILHWFTTSWRESTPFWFFAIAALVVLFIGFYVASSPLGKPGKWFFGTAVLVIAAICFSVPATYNRLNSYYNNTVTIAEGDAADYTERSPYEVAASTSAKSLMNTTGTATITKSLADEGTNGEWNTLVLKRGIWVGYESIQNMDLPLYETAKVSDVKFCNFDERVTLRHDGSLPHNNLSRAIYGMVPLNVDWDTSDAYGYCNEKNEPIVVTPLKQIDGFLYPLWSYYGVALLNGSTGELTIETDAEEINKIPGPVYPLTLAQTQRESLVATGDFWDYWFGTQGNESATENSELNLRATDDESFYVTTLTPRGSSSSVVAVSEVLSGSVDLENGYNTLVLKKLPEEHYRAANSTLVDEIRTKYSYLPEMVNESFQVFEITSGEDGGWVASIGRQQAVNYRAYITATGVITMVDRFGNLVAQSGANGEDLEPVETPSGSPSTELSDMSTEELQQLGKQIMDEIASRAK